MKIKGFISTLFLYYLLFISTYISVQLDAMIKLVHSVDMLEMLNTSVGKTNEAIAYIRCYTLNHGEYASENSYVTHISNDYELNQGKAIIEIMYPIEIVYHFDMQAHLFYIDDISL